LESSSKNSEQKQLKRSAKLDRDIRRGRQWAEERFNSNALVPQFPLEWKVCLPYLTRNRKLRTLVT
jgi:hypothetical protein